MDEIQSESRCRYEHNFECKIDQKNCLIETLKHVFENWYNYIKAILSRGTVSIIFYVYKECLCVCRFESVPCCLYYFVYM